MKGDDGEIVGKEKKKIGNFPDTCTFARRQKVLDLTQKNYS